MMPFLMLLWQMKTTISYKLTNSSFIFGNMNQQDTYSSLLGSYQEAKARSENVLLTLETKDCVETLQLTVSRSAGGSAAGREEKESTG